MSEDNNQEAPKKVYNPELIVKYDPVRDQEGRSGFAGEFDNMKRSDHHKSLPKLYAVGFNHVDVSFRYERPLQVDSPYGKRWLFNLTLVNADLDKMKLTTIEDGIYSTSWYGPTFKFTKCNACGNYFPGKHIDKCDCNATNLYRGTKCRVEAEFKKVMNAAGYDPQRWTEFVFRLMVTPNERGFSIYTLNVLKAPKDATPRTGSSLLGADGEGQEEHWNTELKEKLESTLVPVIFAMNEKGKPLLLEDWIATLKTPDFGVSEEEATRLWEYRHELQGWPSGV